MRNKIIKVTALTILIILVSFCFWACNSEKKGVPLKKIKIGILYSGQSKNEANEEQRHSFLALKDSLNLKESQIVEKSDLTDPFDAYPTILELLDQKCNLIFSTDVEYEDYVIQAAQENPDIRFFQLDGFKSETSGIMNVHNYSLSIYEAKYAAGVIAGMKINDMIANGEISETQAVMGYIGTKSSPEVVSSYTAFYLGAKSIVPDVLMKVQYTGVDDDAESDARAARALISVGCILICEHSRANGAAEICERTGVYYIGNGNSAMDSAPNCSLTFLDVDFSPYYNYAVNSIVNGEDIPLHWSKGFSDKAVFITDTNLKAFSTKDAFDATINKKNEIEKLIKEDKLHVFDTSKWTVRGSKITTTSSEELQDRYRGVEYISEDGYFMEQLLQAPPAFLFHIDGITELNG